MADIRDNELLDEELAADFGTARKRRRRARQPGLSKDQVRRLAFRVLNLLAGFDQARRQRILEHALKLSEV